MNETLIRQAPFVLLDDSQPAQRADVSYLFHTPETIITANSPDQVPAALGAMDQAVADGFYTAGYMAYEAAAGIEEKLSHIFMQPKHAQNPLIWMMVTKHRETLHPSDLDTLFKDSTQGSKRSFDLKVGDAPLSKADYCRAIKTIKDHILDGDVYQINYTFPLPVHISGDPLALYYALRAQQPVPYSAYIETGTQTILSLSPELFIRADGSQIQAQPMKGTIARGRFNDEDIKHQKFLQSDPKSQAENLMIVDLIRNDLSRVAKAGSVTVDQLFDTKIFKSVIQMTSDVTATADSNLSPSQLIKALFPCGSVTGAPKIRAMEIINELETAPRGVYCGAIGHFSPAQNHSPRQWALNVPIRTLSLNKKGEGYFSLGSGIVADSDASSEYEECLLKGRFLTSLGQMPDHTIPFCLFETMRAEIKEINTGEKTPQWQVTDLTAHLERLVSSAAYFDIPLHKQQVEELIRTHLTAETGVASRHYNLRVKLMVGLEGQMTVSSVEMKNPQMTQTPTGAPTAASGTTPVVLKVALSSQRQQSDDPLLFHKTTNRTVYDQGHQKALAHGYADLIYLNERDEITEGCISNIFIQQSPDNSLLLTPALTCGLLPGILRRHYLETGKAKEAVLMLDDLLSAHAIFIGNRLRGLRQVELDALWL